MAEESSGCFNWANRLSIVPQDPKTPRPQDPPLNAQSSAVYATALLTFKRKESLLGIRTVAAFGGELREQELSGPSTTHGQLPLLRFQKGSTRVSGQLSTEVHGICTCRVRESRERRKPCFSKFSRHRLFAIRCFVRFSVACA